MSLADLLGSKPVADEDDDGDASMASPKSQGSGGSGESGSEDERGVDLMGDNTGDEDSSEEEDDDSEEERRVRKGTLGHMYASWSPLQSSAPPSPSSQPRRNRDGCVYSIRRDATCDVEPNTRTRTICRDLHRLLLADASLNRLPPSCRLHRRRG